MSRHEASHKFEDANIRAMPPNIDMTCVEFKFIQSTKKFKSILKKLNSASLYSLTFFPVCADSRAASRMRTTIKLTSKEEGSFSGCILPLNTAAR